jgi:hypothetical protein
MILELLMAAQAVTANAAGVSVNRLDETSFLMSLAAGPTTTAKAAQARLASSAKLACQARRPVLGRYRFVTEEGKTSFEQELICAEPGHKLEVAAAAGKGAALEPSRADQQAVLAASYAYFAAKDEGRYPEAHAFLADPMKARFALADWAASARTFNAEAGSARGRRVVEITWYNNPEDASEPGLYVAADFSADFDKAEFVCGYLMWRVQPDGSFRLVREEQNMAPRRASGRAIAQIDRDPLRARMGCKD